jgi:hypothetical protein
MLAAERREIWRIANWIGFGLLQPIEIPQPANKLQGMVSGLELTVLNALALSTSSTQLRFLVSPLRPD